MARKRKIPVRKHHGVRDPLKQLEAKEKKLKNVVDSPPEKDDQKMSIKFVQFKKLADQAKTGNKIKRIRSGVEDKPRDTKTHKKKTVTKAEEGNKFKSIKQLPGEEDTDYMRRVNRITSASLKEAQYEAKYGVKVVRDSQTGQISIKKKPLNEIDELLKKRKMEANKGGRISKKKTDMKEAKPLDPIYVKQLIKQAIREDEEEKLKEKNKEIVEYRQDVVKFGEIVHAPPTISTLPRKAQKNDTVPRPGKKNNLLLQNILKPQEGKAKETTSSENSPAQTSKKPKALSVNTKKLMKGKRKDLPEATRNMLENERLKLVSLYRDLKKSKGIKSDRS